MAESINPIRPDGRLSRTGLDRVGESTSRQESIFGGMPRIDMGPGESIIQGPAESFWIRIDQVGSTAGEYAATEVARRFGQPGPDDVAGDARKWTLDDNPVQEVNQRDDVEVNTIHRAWNSGEQGVIEFEAAEGTTKTKCDPCMLRLCQVKDPVTGVVTDVRLFLDNGSTVSLPLCNQGWLMPCCNPPQPLPLNLNFRFLSSPSSVDSPISGYMVTTGLSFPGVSQYGLTKQKPPYITNTVFPIQYVSLSDCSILNGAIIPLTFSPIDCGNRGGYHSVKNTNCSAFVDGGGVFRSIDPNRFRLATGTLNGLPTAFDVSVYLCPCAASGAPPYWTMAVFFFLVFTRPPFGDCDINSYIIQQAGFPPSSTALPPMDGTSFFMSGRNILDPTPGLNVTDYPWNWGWGAPFNIPPLHPLCSFLSSDPCHLARPIDLQMGATCPQFCGQFDFGCTYPSQANPLFPNMLWWESGPDGPINIFPTDYYAFPVGPNPNSPTGFDPNVKIFAEFMRAFCPGAATYIEDPNLAPPFYADPNKVGQAWTFRAEIFE